jgi:hypothetical protein
MEKLKQLIKELIRESLSNDILYSAQEVTDLIYNQLDYVEDNDWTFNDYYKFIKNHGKKWKLIKINPNELKYNEDINQETVEDYEWKIESNEEIIPIVIDINKEIIDGNHRATASKNLGKDIKAFIPVS